MAHLDETEPLASRVTVATLDLLVLLVLPVALVPQDPSVQLANRETEERLDPKVPPDHQDLLEPEEWLDPKAPEGTRERQERVEREVRRDTVASPVYRVFLGLLVNQETRVLLDQLGLLDKEDLLDLSVPLERTVPMVYQDPSDHQDPEVALERPVLLVLPETLAPLVLLDPLDQVSTCPPLLACPSRRSRPTPCDT